MTSPSSLALVAIYAVSSCVAEVCYFNGEQTGYCGHGKHCCSLYKDKCCLNEEIGLNIYGMVGLALFGIAVFIIVSVAIVRRCRPRVHRASGPVPTACLQIANQQQGLVFVSSTNLDLPPSYESAYQLYSTEDLPPPYSSYFHPPYSNV